MKKKSKVLVAALLVCLIVQIALPMGALAASAPVSLVDLVRVARSLSGSGQLTAEQQVSYDRNSDGRVDILDLTLMAEALLTASIQDSQNVQLNQPRICDDCHQYPCVCNTSLAAPAVTVPAVSQPAPQPTICPNCNHYPCACSTIAASQPTICPSCSHYPCVCGTVNTGSSSGSSTSTWRCGNCHSNPCVCSSYSSGSGHHSSGSGHHSSSHH